MRRSLPGQHRTTAINAILARMKREFPVKKSLCAICFELFIRDDGIAAVFTRCGADDRNVHHKSATMPIENPGPWEKLPFKMRIDVHPCGQVQDESGGFHHIKTQ